MKRIFYAVLAASVLMFPAKAMALKRMALVIGNSAYAAANALPNPVNDASALAKLFTDAKFDVVEIKLDLSRDAFLQALREFTDKSEDADVVVVYYAGHGMEMGGVNYLVPVDAKLATDTAVADETVSLDRVLLAVGTANASGFAHSDARPAIRSCGACAVQGLLARWGTPVSPVSRSIQATPTSPSPPRPALPLMTGATETTAARLPKP